MGAGYGAVVFALLLITVQRASAQEAQQDDPTARPALPDVIQGESLMDRFNRIHRPSGFALGPFAVTARMDLALGYDTNIFDSRHRAKDDGFVVSGAGLNATSLTPDHFLNLDGFIARTTYIDTSSNDVWSGRMTATGWKDVGTDLRLNGNALVAREVERRDDPQSSPETEPVSYWHYQAGTSLESRYAVVTFRGGLSYDRVDYDDVQSTSGKINLDFRNMNEIDATTRATYNVGEDRSFYLDVIGNIRLPDDKRDNFGVERQSSGTVVSLGADYALTPLIRLVASAGYRLQIYQDSDVDNVSGPVGSLQMLWQPTDTTEVGALFSHDFYESFDFQSPGYWLDVGRVSITQQVRRDIVLVGQATIGSRDFISSSRSETFYAFDASLKWGVMPGLIVSLDNTYEIQTANADNGGFNSNVTLLHVTKSF
ncbi:MAG TPA: outer membrane beta-barrel protein [Terriglobia bacterium]|nr:outer membrane beta-barrel protein [Terriglobia bacterium]